MNNRFFALLLFWAAFCFCVEAQKPVLHFNKDGKFKIVQFTDVHYKPIDDPNHQGVIETMKTILDGENPDMVVFTGDIVVGRPVKKGWETVLNLCEERKIPYAVVFGNHDDEQGTSREGLCQLVSAYPHSLMPTNLYEVQSANCYVVPLLSSAGHKPVASLFMLDSRAYSTIKSIDGYGWFTHDQVSWYRKTSQEIKSANNRKNLPSLGFFHIPLPEHQLAFNNENPKPTGVRGEDECAPKVNSGMFLAMLECENMMGVFVGHDHVNDYVGVWHGIALAYGRGTGAGKTTYGKEIENGARIIELYEGKRKFDTYTLTTHGAPTDFVSYPPRLTMKKNGEGSK